MYGEGLLAVRAKLKRGKMRYVPMPSQLAWELQEFSAVAQRSNAAGDDDRILRQSGVRLAVSNDWKAASATCS
jgi:hypothetical protein